jgi:hypothetical protein
MVEASVSNANKYKSYYKYNNKLTAHFPLNFQLMSIKNDNNKEDTMKFTPLYLKKLVEEWDKSVPSGCWSNWQV